MPQPKQRACPGHTPGPSAALDLGRPQAGRGLDGPAGQGTQRQPAGVEAKRVLVAVAGAYSARPLMHAESTWAPWPCDVATWVGGGEREGWGSGRCEGQGGLTLESV